MRTTLIPVLFAAALLPELCSASPLEQVLAAMDKAGATFRDMTAQLTRLDRTAVINHTSRETGTVRMLRPKPRDIRMLIEFDPPDVRTVSFERNTMQE